jgi:hypothetical protein
MRDIHIDTDIEEDVRRLFTAAADDIPPGTDLLGGLRARQARQVRRTRTRAVLSAATATVLAAGTVFALTATGAPSALAQVTSAASHTAAQSYHVTAVTTTSITGLPGRAGAEQIGAQQHVTAEFDQASGVGEVTTSDGTQIRYVGGYEYLKYPFQTHGRSWLKMRTATALALQARNAAALFESLLRLSQANPQNLLKTLESAGRVQAVGAASGPGWTGTRYEFSASTPRYILQLTPGRHPDTRTIRLKDAVTTNGTVDVDHQGRVRRIDVTVTTPFGFRIPDDEVTHAFVTTIAMTLGDFGAPVSVTAPPASEIAAQPEGIVYAPLNGLGFFGAFSPIVAAYGASAAAAFAVPVQRAAK